MVTHVDKGGVGDGEIKATQAQVPGDEGTITQWSNNPSFLFTHTDQEAIHNTKLCPFGIEPDLALACSSI